MAGNIEMIATLQDNILPKLKRIQQEINATIAKNETANKKSKGVFEEMTSGAKKALGSFTSVKLAAVALGAAVVGGVVTAFRALTRVVSESVEEFAQFEAGMLRVKAVTNASASDMLMMTNQAKKLGETTKFTAREAADAFFEMSKLGLTATQVVTASQGVLDLAAASGEGLARAAEVSVRTLKQFSLAAGKSAMVADVMAKSFTSSALDLNSFAEAMKMVGPVANSTGNTLQVTTGYLAELADKGIAGSQAGTALRRIFLELADSGSKVNAHLKSTGSTAVTATDKLKELSKQNVSVSQLNDMFGLLSVTAADVLTKGLKPLGKDGSTSIEALITKMGEATGTSKRMSKTMQEGIAGARIQYESAVSGMKLALGESFSQGAVDHTNSMKAMVTEATGLIKAYESEIAALGKAFRFVLFGITKIATLTARALVATYEGISVSFSYLVKGILESANWLMEGFNGLAKAFAFDGVDISGLQNLLTGVDASIEASAIKLTMLYEGGQTVQGGLEALGKGSVIAGKGLDTLTDAAIDATAELAALRAADAEERKKQAEKAAKELLSIQRQYEDAKTNLITNEQEKAEAKLFNKHQREIEELGTNYTAQKVLAKAHALELQELQNDFAQRKLTKLKEENEKQASIVKDAHTKLSEQKISAMDEGWAKENETLQLKHAAEMAAVGNNQAAITALTEAHAIERANIMAKYDDQRFEKAKEVFDQTLTLGQDFNKFQLDSMTADKAKQMSAFDAQQAKELENFKGTESAKTRFKEQQETERFNKEKEIADMTSGSRRRARLMYKSAAMGEAIVAGSLAINKAASAFPFPFNMPGIAVMTASTALNVAKIKAQKFAKGGDFTTNGPQMIMVGDNPGGKERVQVTPLSSQNYNGPQPSNVNVSISMAPISIGPGNAVTARDVEQIVNGNSQRMLTELKKNLNEITRRGVR